MADKKKIEVCIREYYPEKEASAPIYVRLDYLGRVVKVLTIDDAKELIAGLKNVLAELEEEA